MAKGFFAKVKPFLPVATIFLIRTTINAEDYVNEFRIIFCAYHGLMAMMMALMYRSITQRANQVKITVKKSDFEQPNSLGAALKELQGKKEEGQEEEKEEEEKITIQEYDMRMLKAKLKPLGMKVCLITFLHFKFEFVTPLLMSCILSIFGLIDDQLWKVHILGVDDTQEDYKRPWKVVDPMAAFDEEPAQPAAVENEAANNDEDADKEEEDGEKPAARKK